MAVNPVKYLQEVRSEAARVRWPTRKETLVTTGMVLLMAVIAAFFFFAVDGVIGYAVRALFAANN